MQFFTNKNLYKGEGREFRGGLDEKMRRMWLGRIIEHVIPRRIFTVVYNIYNIYNIYT